MSVLRGGNLRNVDEMQESANFQALRVVVGLAAL